jgi:hypothetical protein
MHVARELREVGIIGHEQLRDTTAAANTISPRFFASARDHRRQRNLLLSHHVHSEERHSARVQSRAYSL